MPLEGVENQMSKPGLLEKVQFHFSKPDRTSVLMVGQTINKIGWDLPQVNTKLFAYKQVLKQLRYNVMGRVQKNFFITFI